MALFINNELNGLSNFEIAANKLGFKQELKQHEALLKTFQLAGYFKPENIWIDLNRIGKINNIEETFKEIVQVIRLSNADEDDPTLFDANAMSKNLFNSNSFDIQDSMDMILYIAQHAFNRKPGQERNELIAQNWMIKYKSLYMEQAKCLGLIDRKSPKRNIYDFAWIAGASRTSLLKRIIDFNFCLKNYSLKIVGGVIILAGHRELWADFDKINPLFREELLKKFKLNESVDNIQVFDNNNNLSEGKEYIIDLAKRFDIKLNESAPLIEYKTKSECPSGRFLNRVYANYAADEDKKLTETIMAKNLIEIDLKNKLSVTYIDTKACEGTRPTTATTARDAIEECIKLIESDQRFSNRKELTILFESSNPYIERQMLTSQQEADKFIKTRGLDDKGYKILIEGVGCAYNHDNVSLIHSEFGALVAEKWKLATSYENKNLKRNINELLYQTRNNDMEVPNKLESYCKTKINSNNLS